MFQNSFQGGPYVELFDAKNLKQKEKNLYRVTNPHLNLRVFDKQLKNYILDLQGNNKLVFPKQDKHELYLIQQFIVFQMYLHSNSNFTLQLTISDTAKTKRRLIFTYSIHKIEHKPFFIKISNQKFRKDKWTNVCIDLYSFIAAFKGQAYRSLDQIYISGSFKVRKIYTTKNQLTETEGEDNSSESKLTTFLPKHFSYPPGVAYATQNINYFNFYEQTTEKKQVGTDAQSNLQQKSQSKFIDTRKDFSTPKMEIIRQTRGGRSVDQKKFLLNTNNSETLNKLRQQKNANKKQNTLKKFNIEQNSKIQSRKLIQKKTSLQKKSLNKLVSQGQKNNSKEKNIKINPWRNRYGKQMDYQVKQEIQIENNPHQVDINSLKTTNFKKPNIKIYKKLEDYKVQTSNIKGQNTIYSDQGYFQLSQKFSTITDPKFFKPDFIKPSFKNLSTQVQMMQNKIESEIQQQLQINSIPQIKHKQEQQNNQRYSKSDKQLQIESPAPIKQNFMQKHFHKIIEEVERPYTPPLSSVVDESKNNKKQKYQSKEVQLIYDAILNCYYDFKTNTYYELKPS